MKLFAFLILACLALPTLAAELSPLTLFTKRHPAHPAHKFFPDKISTAEAHALITDGSFLKSLKPAEKKALISYRDTLAANLLAAGDPNFPAPEGYNHQDHLGWSLFIHGDLLKNHPRETQRAVHLLRDQLQDIIDRVPAPAVAYLKKVPLYFSPSADGHGGACHHPSSAWLKKNNFPVEMAKTVEFSNILRFERETMRMPNFALHELAHAYHNHLLGDDHPAILKAYQAAKKSGRFNNLPKRTGDPKNPLKKSNGPTYAMTNQMEYFAETTEAYFVENDITPYNRASLREMDPKVLPVLEKVWGVKKPKNVLLTSNRILFLGDSITASRDYVIDLQAALHLEGYAPEIISSGLPSEGVTGLSEPKHPFPRPNAHERLARALEKARPDLVIACYGMNDGIYHPFSLERFAAYQNGIQHLIDDVTTSGAKLILVTPPPFDPQAAKNLVPISAKEFNWTQVYEHYDRDVIAPYARWILAQRDQVTAVVDAHSPINAYHIEKRKTDPKFTLSNDGVHIDRAGHRLLASAIYKSLLQKPLPELPEDLVKYITSRQCILAPAWLSHIGHKRPGTKPGLPLAEAQARAAQVLR